MVLDHLPPLTHHALTRPPTSVGVNALLCALGIGRITADAPYTVDFAGHRWRGVSVAGGAAPTFSGGGEPARNAWVDADGRLHLRLMRSASGWYGAEVATSAPFGYGVYRWVLDSAVDGLDANVVLALGITGSGGVEAPEPGMAVEVARYGNDYAETAQYVMRAGPSRRFWQPVGLRQSTHSMVWTPEGVRFQSACDAVAAPLDATDRRVYARWEHCPVPVQPRVATVRMGLTLYQGRPPAGRQEAEVVVGSFSFTPLAGVHVSKG